MREMFAALAFLIALALVFQPQRAGAWVGSFVAGFQHTRSVAP